MIAKVAVLFAALAAVNASGILYGHGALVNTGVSTSARSQDVFSETTLLVMTSRMDWSANSRSNAPAAALIASPYAGPVAPVVNHVAPAAAVVGHAASYAAPLAIAAPVAAPLAVAAPIAYGGVIGHGAALAPAGLSYGAHLGLGYGLGLSKALIH
ncbi:adult-specific rigid cuticular protein 15.7 [Trichonephila inaurata madagascariensis]|uniref:Adult-specific rigid cuticular protein 15.7 n=1 Tax=Trichonephila inaurata madagascariensis TaxID=2747483 RepID=A0A8X7C926_9ARAC|nr:adult-specific rigid cuticular protein 15.7 [Trichonephila inaurata madagascariensis]